MFRVRRLSRLLCLALTALLIPYPAAAAERTAAVFLDSAILPYRDVLDGFKESCRCTVVEYPARSQSPPSFPAGAASGIPDLVLSIGMDALTTVKDLRGIPVLSTLVPKAQARAVAGDTPGGIDMSLPPDAYFGAMRRLFPDARRVGLITGPAIAGAYVAAAIQAAGSHGFQLVVREWVPGAGVPGLLAGLRGGIDVFWMLPDPVVAREENLEAILLFSFENRVPVFSFARKYVMRGAVAALAVDPRRIGAQAGERARALWGGEARADADWEYVRVHTLVINRKVGAKMGYRLDADALGETVDVVE